MQVLCKSSLWQRFLKIGFTSETLLKRDSDTGIYYEIYEIFKNTFFYRTPLLWWLLLTVNNVSQWRHTLKVYPADKPPADKWYTSTALLRFYIMNIHLRFSKHCWQYPILIMLHGKARSSRPEVFCEKGGFENLANQRCFLVNFRKFSRTPFFLEHLWWLLLTS